MEEYFRIMYGLGLEAVFSDFPANTVINSESFKNFDMMTWGN